MQQTGSTAPQTPRPMVRPRARVSESCAALPVEQLLNRFLGARGIVYLVGGAGSGKTMAIEYLRGVLARGAELALLDEPAVDYWEAAVEARLVVIATDHQEHPNCLARLELAEWSDDDLIEY